ncbi:MAG TPA: hypothetical protein VMU10_09060, partial [Desulfomonilia bacterium]|nr:hypothetical protein [Desulfomonilia bacterium]
VLYFMPSSFFEYYLGGVNIVKIPGSMHSHFSLFLCLVMMPLEVYTIFKLYKIYKDAKPSQSVLLFPAACAVFLILIISVVMPVYDYQRTLKPFAELVKLETYDNRKIALAFNEEKYVGAFTFYLNRPFPILNSPQEVVRFLSIPGNPAAVIVKTEDLEKFKGLIPKGKVRIIKSGHKGYNVDNFRLLMNVPS